MLIINCNLFFDDHIKVYCKKANRKLKPLAWVMPFETFDEKKRTLMNSAFNSQFHYSPLICSRYSRHNSNEIKYFHEKCLWPINSDKKSYHDDLLEKESPFSNHHKIFYTFKLWKLECIRLKFAFLLLFPAISSERTQVTPTIWIISLALGYYMWEIESQEN